MLLVAAFFCVALLYASAGFGGASLYLSVLSFVPGIHHDSLVLTAMVCNIIAVLFSAANYLRAGHLRPKSALPLLFASLPAAFLGGLFKTSHSLFCLVLGASLIAAGLLMLVRFPHSDDVPPLCLTWRFGLAAGAGIGLLSGLVGIGGGVFLAPALAFKKNGRAKEVSALCALFILVNSMAGAAARLVRLHHIPAGLPFAWLVAAVVAGACLGSWAGAFIVAPVWIRRAVAVIVICGGVNQLATFV